jgi:hypothetical protein
MTTPRVRYLFATGAAAWLLMGILVAFTWSAVNRNYDKMIDIERIAAQNDCQDHVLAELDTDFRSGFAGILLFLPLDRLSGDAAEQRALDQLADAANVGIQERIDAECGSNR